MSGRKSSSNKRRQRSARADGAHSYPRTARLSELLREVIADELTLIGDERLELVTVTSVDVDAEMNRAVVYFDSMFGEEGDAAVTEALGEHRARIQASINRQLHARKTPVLSFRPDEAIRSYERIEQVLRADREAREHRETDTAREPRETDTARESRETDTAG